MRGWSLGCVAVGVVLLTGCTSGIGRPASVPAPQHTPRVVVRVVHTLKLPEGPGPWGAAEGAVWLTTPGLPTVLPEVGHLERLNIHTGMATVVAPVGGDPVSVSVQGDVAWVASGLGDGTTPTADANMVVQIQLPGGQILQRYRVTNPVGVVSDGGRVFVLTGVAGGGSAQLYALANGQTKQIATLSGGPALSNGMDPVVVGCRQYLYALTGSGLSSTTLTQISLSGSETKHWHIKGGGSSALACAPGGAVVTIANKSDGGTWLVPVGAPRAVGPVGTRFAVGAVVLDHIVWVVGGASAGAQGYAWPSGRALTRRIPLPPGGPAMPIIVSANRFWVMNGDGQIVVAEVSQ